MTHLHLVLSYHQILGTSKSPTKSLKHLNIWITKSLESIINWRYYFIHALCSIFMTKVFSLYLIVSDNLIQSIVMVVIIFFKFILGKRKLMFITKYFTSFTQHITKLAWVWLCYAVAYPLIWPTKFFGFAVTMRIIC